VQTILGSGGGIGNETAKNLLRFTDKIRLVSRNPKQVNKTDEIYSADLTNNEEVIKAVHGSDVVYLTVGLQYKLSIWQAQWHQIMSNVIEACKKNNSKLVFFDNVYSYGLVKGKMTEATQYNPSSKKGELRAKIAEQLMAEVKAGSLNAMIVRSADFYGPGAINTFTHPMVFEKLKTHKTANWLANDSVKHSFTYVPDAGNATAVLGNTPTAYNQIWHLPTDKDALTGKEFIEKVAACYNANPKYTVLKSWMMKAAGLFNPLAKESVEMLYQYEYEYLFDSTKFENAFFQPTSYQTGIEAEAKW